ncbi:hypothetical protein MMC07_002980 [Pseudocyphellaria aurata]|nr:hypothetical protein [Pseudocyphellaria aurata]
MVTLSSQPKQVSLSSTPSQDVGSLTTPLTLPSVHELWTQALSLKPPSPSLSLSQLKRLMRMLNLLPRPLLTPEQTAPLYLNVALILAYLGEYFLAAESFHKAVELDEKCAIGWHGLGGMNFLLGNWKAARTAWKTCLVCLGARESLKYNVWKIGGSGSETEDGKTEMEWLLEKTRVEWNLMFAVLKNQEERERLQEKVWGINGIPAGLVFGPSFPAFINNLYDEKENKDLKMGHIEGAQVNARQHNSTNVPQANSRATSHGTDAATKPLPALPDHSPSTAVPLPRIQKGISFSRLFNRPRTSSASKARAPTPKRSDLPGAPFVCTDLSTPLPEGSFFRASSATRAGTVLYSKFDDPDFFDGVFDLDSEEDPDAGEHANELDYYFSTRPEPEVEMRHALTNRAPVGSKSLSTLPRRTPSYRSGRIQYPMMEMRDEFRQEKREQEMRVQEMREQEMREQEMREQEMRKQEMRRRGIPEREINSQTRGRKRDAIPIEAEKEVRKVTIAMENELRRIARWVEYKAYKEAVAEIRAKEAKDWPTEVEDEKWDQTAIKEENRRNAFARNLNLEHKDTETEQSAIGRDEKRTRRNVETQTAVRSRGVEKKTVLETVPEIGTTAESQETEENTQVRGRSDRKDVENQTAVKGLKAGKEKFLETNTPSQSPNAEEKDEVRGSSKRRTLETPTALKGQEEQKEKTVEMSVAGSRNTKRKERMSTGEKPKKPKPAKAELTVQKTELEYLKPARFEGFPPTSKEPKKPEPAKAKPSVQELEVEYLKPIRFEGFNGEWRLKDLEYEAEDRMKMEKLNGGK